MKKYVIQLSMAALLFSGLSVQSCKNKNKDTNTTNTTTNIDTTPTNTAPVAVNNDAALRTSANNIVQQYPGVTADVNDGVVTLRGSIKRDNLQKLMMEMNEIQARRIDNQLSIK